MKKGINPAALSALMNDDLDNFRVASTPGGIEAQEAQGQKNFLASESIPIQCPKEELEKLGFVFGEPVDDLFIKCKLPDGWKIEATDHSMWSTILDNKGKERASIFYKAAFYDRSAFLRLDEVRK